MSDMPHEPLFDGSHAAAARDQSTVTKDGTAIVTVIDGVRTRKPPVHADHRGRVFEIYQGQSDYWTEPVVYCYAFTIRPGQVKGWGLHERKTDRYTLIAGEVLTILYDPRLESPTHGMVQRVMLTEQGARSLTIPVGVWHMNINVGPHEVFLINHPTDVYHHDRPDRLLLPWDSPEIPVDVAAYFPIQTGSTRR